MPFFKKKPKKIPLDPIYLNYLTTKSAEIATKLSKDPDNKYYQGAYDTIDSIICEFRYMKHAETEPTGSQ